MRPRFGHLRRRLEVLVVATRYFLVPELPFRRDRSPSRAVRVRLALEELGGAWIKLGQMLALRFDLVPPAYGDELFKLWNRVAPFPYAQVQETIRQELGDVPEVVFAAFERESFAAASIGQVHRAVLHTGERVAVKVQRPRVRETLRADIDLMYSLARVLDWRRVFGATGSRQVIDEFARWTGDELDYLVEARHALLLHEQARDTHLERIPWVYRDYSTSRVLTSELIEGIPLIEVMSAVREHNADYLDSLRARGYDLDAVVRHLDWNMLNQVYVFGAFHADLHPANLLILPGNAVGYVDFGIIGRLPRDVRESLTRYGWLLFHGDVEAAVRELMRWLRPTPATDTAAARRDLVRVHEAFLYDTGAATGLASVPVARGTTHRREGADETDAARSNGRTGWRRDRVGDNPYSRLAVDTMRALRDHELTISPSIVAYLRMLVTLGILRHYLATDYDLVASVRRFFDRMIRQEGMRWLDPRLMVGRAYAGALRVRRAMEFVEFLESQQSVIATAESTLFGLRHRLHATRRRLINLGVSAVVVGAALYVVLADPSGTRAILPSGIPYGVVHAGLVVLLLVIVITLIIFVRRISGE